jgi:hypothetical protein
MAERLQLRGLSGWEEEYIERHQTDPNTARLCNEVLARCLVAPGDEPDAAARERVRALLVAERDRELVALRRLSLGPEVSARVPCPECGAESEAEFSLDTLPLDFEPPPRELTVMLPDGAARLRLPTAGDQEELLDAGLRSEAEERSWLLARCLLSYGDRETGFDRDFARGLPVAARTALEAALEGQLPDLDLEMAVTCSQCGAAILAPFDVPVFFFFELTGRAHALLRDVHRIARTYHWSERDILTLTLDRRLGYLLLLEEEADAALLAGMMESA